MKIIYTNEEKQYLEENYNVNLCGKDFLDTKVKEYRKAKTMGMTVEEMRKHFSIENKKKTYICKIARYEKAIAEMKKFLKENA